MVKNVILIGFMGTGKTSSGKLLASKLGFSFMDTDAVIEEKNDMTISEMFAKNGEAFFRAKETELLRELLTTKNTVISTGGGIIVTPENIELLRKIGIVVCLYAEPEVVFERTRRRHERPLLETEDQLQTINDLMNKRKELYAQADYSVDTGVLSPLQVVDEILHYLRKAGNVRA